MLCQARFKKEQSWSWGRRLRFFVHQCRVFHGRSMSASHVISNGRNENPKNVITNCYGSIREYHGLANPRGSRVRVAAGAGAGCRIPTCDQPSPATRVTQTHCGLSFSPSGWARVSFFQHVHLLHCHHPWRQVAVVLLWLNVCQLWEQTNAPYRSTKFLAINKLNQQTFSRLAFMNFLSQSSEVRTLFSPFRKEC